MVKCFGGMGGVIRGTGFREYKKDLFNSSNNNIRRNFQVIVLKK